MNCSVCSHPLPENARFCPNCGAAVESLLGTEERKMVTVLFADLVDSTGLAQKMDPERAREVLGSFFDAAAMELQALRGRVEKFIGDAVMASSACLMFTRTTLCALSEPASQSGVGPEGWVNRSGSPNRSRSE